MEKQTIVFATGNSFKFKIAQKELKGTGIELAQKKIDVPEIQSDDVKEIAKFSAEWAAKKIGKPAAVTDAGYYIEALNGFPGPFIKYINEWLTSEDFLKLMKGKTNRKVLVKMCLAYAEPDKEAVSFLREFNGSVSENAVGSENGNEATSINEIFIPGGFEKVEAAISMDHRISYWAKAQDYWKDLVKYLYE